LRETNVNDFTNFSLAETPLRMLCCFARRPQGGANMPIGREASDGSIGPTGEWIDRFNALGQDDAKRYGLMVQRFASVGEHALIRPPFFCDFGYNIALGAGAFLNYNCIILDVEAVSIGEGTAIGPGVQILASDHPRDPALRRQKVRFGRPVTIGANVWIGGGAIILPGITIGDDAIVGAGSVVTRDVAAGVTVVGNPAREKLAAAPNKGRI
jgi:maltose O-acetyltransferase